MRGSMTVQDIDRISFQRREWAVERVWWVLWAGLILAALLGVFSSGVLSETTAGSADAGVEVEYERFVRYTGMATWTVSLHPEAVSGQTATFFVSDELVRSMQIQQISPQPSSEISTRNGTVYEFDAQDASSPPVVRITFRPEELGTVDGTVAAGDAARVPLSLFVYP